MSEELFSREVVVRWLEGCIEWLRTREVDGDDPDDDEEERAKDVRYFRSALEYVRRGEQ